MNWGHRVSAGESVALSTESTALRPASSTLFCEKAGATDTRGSLLIAGSDKETGSSLRWSRGSGMGVFKRFT